MIANNIKNLRWLFLSLIVILLDQLTKYLAVMHLTETPLPIFPSLNFTLLFNPGIAFSLLRDVGFLHQWLMVIISFIVTLVILVWLYRLPKASKLAGSALAIILGGALSNLGDRVFHGHVTDFIQVYYRQWSWPVFNVADAAICIGAALLVIAIFRNEL